LFFCRYRLLLIKHPAEVQRTDQPQRTTIMRYSNFSLPLLAVLLLSCTPTYYRGPVSDHFDGERFFNPGKPMDKTFVDVLKWYATRERQPWPD